MGESIHRTSIPIKDGANYFVKVEDDRILGRKIIVLEERVPTPKRENITDQCSVELIIVYRGESQYGRQGQSTRDSRGNSRSRLW